MTTFVPFRLTVNKQYSETEFNNFISKHSAVVMAFEISRDDVDHFHGYFLGGYSKSSVINWLKTELNCKSNSDYSMTTKSLKENPGIEGYQRYICKGTKEYPPNKFYGMTTEEVLTRHTAYWHNREEYIKNKKLENKSIKSKVLSYYTEKVAGRKTDKAKGWSAVRIILEFYKESDTPVSSNVVENMYHYVRTMTEDTYVEARADNIYERITKFESHFTK